MKDEPVSHLVEPDGVVLAQDRRRISGAYTRCGLFIRDVPAPGERVNCRECLRASREDERSLQRLTEG
jgi:hypothetical protein